MRLLIQPVREELFSNDSQQPTNELRLAELEIAEAERPAVAHPRHG